MVLSKVKKLAGVYCCVYGCHEKPQKKKGGICHKHYKRKRRKIDPIGVRYNDLAGSCKRRGKGLYFILEEFRGWCKRTGYMRKGNRGQVATLDRRCNAHDYYLWNLRIISNRRNASKGNGFSGAIFTREHHFGTSPDNWEAAGGDLPF
jgi:hypothetical protein